VVALDASTATVFSAAHFLVDGEETLAWAAPVANSIQASESNEEREPHLTLASALNASAASPSPGHIRPGGGFGFQQPVRAIVNVDQGRKQGGGGFIRSTEFYGAGASAISQAVTFWPPSVVQVPKLVGAIAAE